MFKHYLSHPKVLALTAESGCCPQTLDCKVRPQFPHNTRQFIFWAPRPQSVFNGVVGFTLKGACSDEVCS